MLVFAAVITASLLTASESFHFSGRGISKIHNLPTETQTCLRNINHISSKNCATFSSRLLLSAVAKKSEGTPEGEKKPRAARKPKVVSDATAETSPGNIDEPAIIKKPVKAKASKTVSDTDKVEKVASVKKVKDVKATSSSDASTKLPKVKTTKLTLGATEKSIKDDFEGNDMFDLKELLGDDFLSEGEGLGLLPNLDEDLAKLEANLNELGDFGFDFRDDEDDDEALRSIESGKFDIEDFLKEKDGADEVDDLDLLSVLSDLGGKKGNSESLTLPGGKAKKVAEPNKKKKEKAIQPTLQQAMKGVQEDEDDDDEGLEDESVSDQVLEELALSLGLGGDDLMDVDFDGEDDEEPVKNLKKSLLDGGAGKDSSDGFDGSLDKDKQSSSPLIIDGMEVDREGFELGVEPPPLEEFKRLMESLGPDSMFADDYADSLAADEYVQPEAIPVKVYKEPNDRTKAWLPLVYEGGKSSRIASKPEIAKSLDWWLIDHEGAAPSDWRVQVISVVTNSSNANTTALDMVNMVYDHIQRGLTAEENERVSFQILCYEQENGEPMEELEDSIQMWLESYNTYHLVDGAAMKEAWGSIMPHIMLAEKNLNAILDQVRWALAEDTFEGALLTPRLRRLRFRGGAQEMTTGFNTEQLDSEFSVVSVR